MELAEKALMIQPIFVPQAESWEDYEERLHRAGYRIIHCAHCGRPGRGDAWGVPGNDHPTCLIVPAPAERPP